MPYYFKLHIKPHIWHFDFENILCLVAFKCMNLQRSARTLPRRSFSIKPPSKITPRCRQSQTSIYLKTRQTTRIFTVQLNTLRKNIQINVFILVLFKYILFLMLMIMNVIVIFPHVEPDNAKTVKFWLQLINITKCAIRTQKSLKY